MSEAPTRAISWMRQGTAVLTGVVARLDDVALEAPSTLPGWSRAHVVGHLARNAEALGRLVTWARTGVETPMYAGPERRAREIEESAQYPPDRLRAELVSTAVDLEEALGSLDADTWDARVRSALGRDIAATEVPWMRAREVWLHAVDLGWAPGPGDLPADFVDALLDDVTVTLSRREGCPAVGLVPTDRERRWALGDAHEVRVSGPAADLALWLVGRDDGSRLSAWDPTGVVPLPVLPAWI